MVRILIMLLAFAFALPALAERRVALVVGNADYEHAIRLANPQNDANAISGKLTALGFEVFLYENLDGQAFRIALGGFAEEALRSDLAVVFYAGHGIEMGGRNYLIPTDAKMTSEATAQFEVLSLEDVLSTVRNAGKLGLVMLDACRDNPFANTMERKNGTRAVSRGLAPVTLEGGAGTLISFAAQAGDVAADGDGLHSPYTEALLQLMGEPGLEIGALFQRVTNVVKEKTDGRQKPMYRIQPPEDLVYLSPPISNVQPRPETTTQEDPLVAFLKAMQTGQRTPLEDFIERHPTHDKVSDAKRLLINIAEQELWDKMKLQDTINGYDTYLIAFPGGRFAQVAQGRKAQMQAAARPQPVPKLAIKQTPAETQTSKIGTRQANPSFNCARASTVIEKTICSSPMLADQDVKLAQAFRQSRARNQVTNAKEQLWVKLRSEVCLSDIEECVHAVTHERIRSLTQGGGKNTQSPSFNCARARTPVEIAICSYAPLAYQDHLLVLYHKQAPSNFIASQANWIGQRERLCGAKTGDSLPLCVARYTARRFGRVANIDIDLED